jgi:glycosyltransferase involved in cell wall biosynthesis
LKLFSAGLLCSASAASCANVDSLGVATLEEQRALISDAASTSPNLQPGEKIKVTVFGEDRLSGEYEIDPGGNISLPLAGTIKAAGLSQRELEVALTKKFQGEYLRDPKVTVEVANFRPFYILGEIAKPGEYQYNFRRSLALAARTAGHEVVLVSPAGPYAQRLRDLGLRWIAAPMRRGSLNPLRELALLVWFWRLVRAERADVVHGFTIKCAVYGALAARLAGLACVSSVDGMGYVFISEKPSVRVLRCLVQELMRVAFGGPNVRIVLLNRHDVALFKRVGAASMSSVRRIPGSGVDCRRFAPPTIEQRNGGTGPMRVLLAARMLWDKGVGEFVEAARILKREGRDVQFVLAGQPDFGNPAAIPAQVLSDWRSVGLVEWLGHIDDMPALFASVDVVALPSYREGLPASLIEAAACGRPLVTTDAPGCSDVVSDGVDGLIVPARDAAALARAIARLQDDPALAARLGEAARAKALAVYDERHIVARTFEVYRELVGERLAKRLGEASIRPI